MKTKKIFALGLAAISAFAMSATAMAYTAPADVTISVPSTDTHSYDAYQIFTGNVATDGKLQNIMWGANAKLPEDVNVGDPVSPEDIHALQSIISGDTNADDARELTVIESQFVNFDSEPVAKDIKHGSPATVKSGYYLIKDKDGAELPTGDTYSQFIVRVADSFDISRKATTAKPVIDKEVNGIEGTDAKAGDDVEYSIAVTVPDNIQAYKFYKFVVTDNLDAGLIYKTNPTVTFYEDGDVSKDGVTYGTITPSNNAFSFDSGNIMTNSVTEGKVNSASKFVITYEATVTADAALVNNNEATLSYSNNPNATDGGDLNESPSDTSTVYTYTLNITEVDAAGTPINGVGLELYRKNDNDSDYTKVAEATTVNGIATFTALDSGVYRLEEVTVPDGFSKHDDVNFTITGTIENNQLTKLESNIGDQQPPVISSEVNNDGIVNATIGNNLTSSLPVTGTIGIVALGGAAIAAIGTAIGMRIKGKKDEDED